jgi:hypothetical protein
VARALTRAEYLLCLLNFAAMAYVMPGTIDALSDALNELITNKMAPAVPGRALHDANEFRRTCCYTHDVTDVLSSYASRAR